MPPQEVAAHRYRLLEQVGVGGDQDVDRPGCLGQLLVQATGESGRWARSVNGGEQGFGGDLRGDPVVYGVNQAIGNVGFLAALVAVEHHDVLGTITDSEAAAACSRAGVRHAGC